MPICSGPAKPIDISANDRVSLSERVAYGSGNFATQMVFNPATAFMVYFYTDIAGIAAATVGTMMLFSRLLDVLNPVMGMIVDRTNSRWGKGRPWLLGMAVPFGLSAMLLFTVPNLGSHGKLIYAFVTYNLAFAVIYTMIDNPYSVLLPLITSDRHQRTMLNITRMILANCGIILSFALTLPLVQYFGGGKKGWQLTFVGFGTLATVLLLICFTFTKERIIPVGQQTRPPFIVCMKSLICNKHWLLLMILSMAKFITLGLYQANVYFCHYYLHNAELVGTLMTMHIAAQVAGMIAVGPIIKKFGKRNTALVGVGIAIVGQLVMYIAPTSYLFVAIGIVVKGLGVAPLFGTFFAMIADVIDYEEWRSGFRLDGLTFGTMAFAMKSCAGLGGAITGWVLGWGDYKAGASIQSPAAMAAIKTLFLHIPLGLFVVMAILLWIYSLDKEYKSINADLVLRRATAQAN
ncbi:MAG: glycoside-pentoside-hexuronide (GPH):cation symporter [Formivibrio sp.]|nr:glycoside-pentoside-hexuronide (GPH):cation symporter [Formivibrio sp.]